MMNSMSTWKGIIGILAVVAIGSALVWQYSKGSSGEVRTVRWVLAHQPTDVYENAIRVFAETLSTETGGRLKLEVVDPKEAGFAGEKDISYKEAIGLLDDGKAELTSVYSAAATTLTSEPALAIVNLPYLFKDYANASRVFDGPAGSAMLEAYSSVTTMRALAFTYSGGYRLLASKKPLGTVADLKGAKIAVSGGIPVEAFWRSLGAVPVRMNLESGTENLSDIVAVETTYTRLSEVLGTYDTFTRNILETEHSLFTTILVASDAFFDSLSVEDQQALMRAARAAAVVEREDSIALAERTRAEALTKGSSITSPAPELRARFMQSAKAVYAELRSSINQELLLSIQQAQP